MTMSSVILLPGDSTPETTVSHPHNDSSLVLGPGIMFGPPRDLKATIAGQYNFSQRKRAAWLEGGTGGKYIATTGDLVVGVVHHSSTDAYHVLLSPYAAFATLPQLAFENASKKTRPVLSAGSVVYARVAVTSRNMDPELECIHPATGKSEGLGELRGGLDIDISLGLARRLLMGGKDRGDKVNVLEHLASQGLRFEVAIGRNGKFWIKSDDPKTAMVVLRSVQAEDQGNFGLDERSKRSQVPSKSTRGVGA